MGEFLALLLAYYTCDAAAQAQQPLSGDRLACVDTYEQVKAFFTPLTEAPFGTPEWAAQRIETYLACSTWEEANADLVAELRAQAASAVE